MIIIVDNYHKLFLTATNWDGEQSVDAQDIKVKSLQMDMLKEVSSMLKIAASMDDENASSINGVVLQLDSLANELEARLCKAAQLNPANQVSHLKLV